MTQPSFEIFGKRNPKIIFKHEDKEYILQTIGDPHLGRNYRNNLKHRLGDREESIKKTFIDLLNLESNVTVIMGDLLDKVVISNEWLTFIRDTLAVIALKNPHRVFVILNGNHDEVKDKRRVSSFQLLEKYFERYKGNNLIFVSHESLNVPLPDFNLNLFFTNYDAFDTIDDLLTIEDLNINKDYLNVAFGHFEIEAFDSTKFINREIPNLLLDNFDLIVTGHIHKPSVTNVKGKTVIVTGSMQPYAFGEEIEGEDNFYKTLSFSEFTRILDFNPDAFINTNLRVHYSKNDELIDFINCLSINYILVNDESNIQNTIITTTPRPFASLFLEQLNLKKDGTNDSFVEKLEQIFLEKDFESN